MVSNRGLLVAGLVLVAAGLLGVSSLAPSGGWSWGMHGGPMMGWWSSGTTGAVGAGPVPDAPTVEVVATEFGFSPDRLTLPAGETVNLTLVNQGRLLHDLTIPGLDVRIVAGPGDTATAGVVLEEPGEYPFLCTVPGHSEAGMTGVLVVEPSTP